MNGNFRKALQSGKIIIFDGAMGTELSARGVEPSVAANITAADVVLEVHRAYRSAGADVLITNTFDVNGQMLKAKAGAKASLEHACRVACEKAREAAGNDGFVAGDMGPTGALLVPHGTATTKEMQDVFLATAKLLAKNGVDLFIVETMSDDIEMMLAIHACCDVAEHEKRDIPVAASMAFDLSRQGDFRTNMGIRTMFSEIAPPPPVGPHSAVEAMIEADIIGANCGSITPHEMADLVWNLRRGKKPILAQANAGVPELQSGKTVFRLAPEAWADGMLEVKAAGAQLLGGCCGTTPEHIRCLRQALAK